jgi:hypothetical protein
MKIEDLDNLFSRYSYSEFNGLFPNTILDERASFKMGCCIGFIYGLKLAGNLLDYEHYVDNFIRVFNHPYINPTETTDSDRTYPTKEGLMPTPASVCVLSDDGSALSFAFGLYTYTKQKGERTIEHGLWKDRYQFCMNGGIIFHGLQEQFSITFNNNPGWQIHT